MESLSSQKILISLAIQNFSGLRNSCRRDIGKFFESSVPNDKEGAWTLDFLTREIEFFFLNRMICYKRCFWQIMRESQSKLNTGWNKDFFISFLKKFYSLEGSKKFRISTWGRTRFNSGKNNSGRNRISSIGYTSTSARRGFLGSKLYEKQGFLDTNF